jgi:hypothetical protein
MPKLCYQEIKFKTASLEVIDQANEIIAEYQRQGFVLTLRQLYYQFVSRDLIPNTQRSYKRLGNIINDARMAGLLDWAAIEDRTREMKEQAHWDDPAEIVRACANQYRVDRWANQDYRPQVWIEKEALSGVIEGVCRRYDVPFLACKGYVSQSAQWRAGRQHYSQLGDGQTPVVLHLGDHDPSGLDMTRDNRDRLRTFAEEPVEIRRLALNMSQVDEYHPPPNPAKQTDARFQSYFALHGDESWELDALEPRVLVALIEEEILSLTDPDAWNESGRQQAAGRERLAQVAEQLGEEA